MKKDYDFSKAKQGKFYRPIEELEIPVDLETEVKDCISKIDELNGYYVYSIMGFINNYGHICKAIENSRVYSSSDEPNINKIPYHFLGEGLVDQFAHETTVGEFKKCNEENGKNYIRAAQLLIVMIFIFWEEEYREKIAAASSLKKQDLKIPIFGDLRLLRNAIVHDKGIIKETTYSNLKVIKGIVCEIKENEELRLSDNQVQRLIAELKGALNNYLIGLQN